MLLKILVVDDSASDRLIIMNMLSEYNILTARDGVEALRMLEEHRGINLMILDLNMPNMNGFEVLEALRADGKLRKMRTIILTNHDELDNEIRGLELGAVDFIRKPIHMDSLKVRIDVHAALLRAQQALEQKLQAQGVTLEMIFNQVPVGIAISHSKEAIAAGMNQYFSTNPAFEEITGRTKEELLRMGWAAITHPDDVEEDLRNYKKLQAGEIDSYAMDKRFVRPDGSVVWVHMIGARLVLSDNHQFNHIALFKDITDNKLIEKQLVESERSKSVLLSHLPGMAYRCNYDREWTMQFISAGCLDLTGYPPESLLFNKDGSFNDLIVPEYREPLWQEWERVLRNRQSFSYEYEITTAAGERKWVLEMGQGVYDEKDEVEALEGIIIDISDRKAIENTLKYNNEHDTWTGLYNRGYLENLLNQDAKKRLDSERALVSINLSSLQQLAREFGFHYTQNIIKNVAGALSSHSTDSRLLFYTYENRFVFYVKNYNDRAELDAFCDSIIDTLEPILSIENVGGGIGAIEIGRNHSDNPDQLLKNLLIASEKAAENNDNDFRVCFYDSEVERQIVRKQQIENELNRIVIDTNDGGLYLEYQPIFDLRTNQVCGFEALARLRSYAFGQVPPLEFISIAERTKLIIPIGNKIFRQAFGFINKLIASGHGEINVSVNVSILQLLEQGFYENLLALIHKMQVPPKSVGLEITESIFASNYLEINRILSGLKEAGLHLSIDDFGTGYSSLARESELNVNCLKIDKFFIDTLSRKPEKAIVADIVSMAHKFDHCTVAEGVEHEEQMQYLKMHGCDKIQGYLISKPLDEAAALEFINRYRGP